MKTAVRPLPAAIVGCGWAAGWHVDDLRQLPNLFSLVGCCDLDERRLREFAERHQVPLRTRDYSDLLGNPSVEVIIICTPPALHYPMVMEALAAGKHVVCEKPFMASLAQVDSIRAAQTRSAGRVMPVFQYRFGHGIAKVRHVIQSGLAGKHYVSSVEMARTRGPDYYQVAWRGKFATELGGVLVTQGIHNHDLLYWLVGPAASVMSFQTTRVNPIEVEDCAVASLKMVDGSLCSLTATLGSVGEATRLRFCFEHATFEKTLGHGALRTADDPWVVTPRSKAIGEEISRAMQQVPVGRSWFAGQYESFHEAILSGGPFPVTIEDARASIELITALYHSNRSGTAVPLPIGPEHPGYEGWIPDQAPGVLAGAVSV